MNQEVLYDNTDELEELELNDRWSGNTSPTLWSDDVALPEELLKLREELEQQNDEARAWLEEECAADEILRSEINELQIAQQKNQNLLSLELQLPAEVRDKINSLEIQVRTLQDEVQDKSDKLAQTYEVYSEVLAKLNETNERVIANDDKFKQSLLKVKDEYAQIEQVLKNNLETYKKLNKELELQLNEKDSELIDLKEANKNALEADESLKVAEEKIQSLTSSNENLSKYNLKIKAHLKKLKESEKETLQKNKEALDRIERMSNTIVELEEENLKLKEQSSNSENIEALINRITLLEEEKGNLQLQLVDLDEVKESALSTEARFTELEKEKDSLLAKLKEVEEQNNDIANGYEKAKEKLVEHEETIASLKDALQKANEEKISSAMKLVEMEENFAQNERDLTSEKSLKSRLENDLSKLNDEIQSYKSLNHSLTIENQDLKTQKDFLDTSLREAQLKNEKIQKDDNLSNKYKQLVVNYKKKKQLCIDLEAELGRLKQEKSPDIENLSENLSVKEKELDLLNELYNKEVARNQDLMSDLNNLQKETQEISSLYTNQISFLEEQISSFTPNIVFLQSQMEQKTLFYNEKLSELIGKLEKYERDVQILKKDEEFLKNKIVNVQAEFDDVQEMLEATQLRNTTVEKELKDALATIDGLSAEIEVLREAQSAKNELESTRATLDKISIDLGESQARNLTLEENLKKASATIEELEVKNQEKTSLENHIQANIEKMSFDLEQIQVRNANLEEELKKAYGTIEKMSFELQHAQEIEMKNFALEEQLRNASSTLDQMSIENQKHHQDELKEARAIMDRMSFEHQETLMKNASLEEEIKKAYGTIEKMSSDLQSLQEVHLKNAELENELKTLRGSIDETSTELKNLREIRDAYNMTLDKIEVLNLDLNKTIESFETTNSERDNLLQERETLVMRLNELEDFYAELESKHALSEMSVENLKSEVDTKEIQLKEMENRLIQNTQYIEQLQLSLNEKINQVEHTKEPEMKVFTFGEENPFGELKDEEDGWGWKGEGDKEVQKIKEERDSLLSELESYKLKCQKYIKKIKEMKSEMEKNKKDDFGDFGLAIQEELRSENDTLSKKLAELNSQLNSFKSEKENLLKRVETLTSANEQLIDMKERQDIEVQMWQKRSNELATQLKGMEITGNGDSAVKLAEVTSELETARKQLALLQRNDDLETTETKDIETLKASLEGKQKENEALKIECENLKTELSSYTDRMREIDDYYQQTILTKDEENSHLMCTISSRDKSLAEAKKEKEKLEEMLKFQSPEEVQQLKTLCDEYTSRIQEKEEELNEKNRQISELQSYIANIQNGGERNQEIERLAEMVSQSHIRLEALSEQLAIKNQELLQVHEQMTNFNDYEEIRNNLSSVQQEKTNLEKLLQEKLADLEKLEKELVTYKNTKESDLLKNKDLEIERLSNILNVTREKLVQKIQTEEARMSPYVKTIQNKLDQALYTVHERDVRIEELTREIHELLMERDTLQIKLSEYMRAYNLLTSQSEPSKGQNIATIDSRITELQAGYNKDPVVQKERESRHIEHMQLYQNDSQTEDNTSAADYGIFNWFFGGSPQPTGTSNESS